MRRLLAAAALAGASLLATASPAQACELEHCPWGQVVCPLVGSCEVDPRVPQCLLVARPFACIQ